MGMSAEVKQQIFNPFFTTKPVGKGTGLGLTISSKIIEQHSGNIELISQENKGTKFIITIPQKISTMTTAESDQSSVEKVAIIGR